MPSPLDLDYDSFIYNLKSYNQCTEKCVERKKDAVGVRGPSIESLKKELSACQSQLQLVQEEEPVIYNKLLRDYKTIDDELSDRCSVGGRPGCRREEKMTRPSSIRDTEAAAK